MRVLSYLRMEIDPDQIEAYEEDLEEMIRMAGESDHHGQTVCSGRVAM